MPRELLGAVRTTRSQRRRPSDRSVGSRPPPSRVISAYDIGGRHRHVDLPVDAARAIRTSRRRTPPTWSSIGLGGAPVPVGWVDAPKAPRRRDHPRLRLDQHPSTTGSVRAVLRDRRHTTDGPPPAARRAPPRRSDRRRRAAVGEAGEILSARARLCFGYTNPAPRRSVRRRQLVPPRDIGMLDAHGSLTDHRPRQGHHRPGSRTCRPRGSMTPSPGRGIAEVAVVAAPIPPRRARLRVVRMLPAARSLELADLLPHLRPPPRTSRWPEEFHVVTVSPGAASGKVRESICTPIYDS